LAAKGQVNCYCCNGEAKKFGRFENKNRIVQRYRCLKCGKTMSESQPLDGLRVDFKQACNVVHLLCEGMGIRSIERFTRLHRDTVLSILETAGDKCSRLLNEKVRNVTSKFVQVDEVHGFCFSKPQNTKLGDDEHGEQFTYLSMDKESKLIINWLVGKRKGENTLAFMQDLKSRMAGRFQLTTDAYTGYRSGSGAVQNVFGKEISFATETKIFGKPDLKGVSRWFNPMVVIGIKRKARIGNPDLSQATTCHAERMNLSLRLFSRRWTRKSLGYSKKLENMRHAVAIFAAHFNFIRKHSAHGMTPAQSAKLTDHAWTIEEMLAETN
jgi:transposase-like protein/IS1 family transposase